MEQFMETPTFHGTWNMKHSLQHYMEYSLENLKFLGTIQGKFRTFNGTFHAIFFGKFNTLERGTFNIPWNREHGTWNLEDETFHGTLHGEFQRKFYGTWNNPCNLEKSMEPGIFHGVCSKFHGMIRVPRNLL